MQRTYVSSEKESADGWAVKVSLKRSGCDEVR